MKPARLHIYDITAQNTRRQPARLHFSVEATNDAGAYRAARDEAARRLSTTPAAIRVLTLKARA